MIIFLGGMIAYTKDGFKAVVASDNGALNSFEYCFLIL